eukprot:15466103-Alexandrium_andersonii.AAC.1
MLGCSSGRKQSWVAVLRASRHSRGRSRAKPRQHMAYPCPKPGVGDRVGALGIRGWLPEAPREARRLRCSFRLLGVPHRSVADTAILYSEMSLG